VLPAPVDPILAVIPAVLAALAMSAVALAPRVAGRLTARASRRARHPRLRRGAQTVAAGVREAIGLIRHGNALALLGAAGYVAFDIAALACTFAALGAPVRTGTLLLGYLLGQLGGLLPVPGGVGGTDGALIGALVLFGAELSVAAAAVNRLPTVPVVAAGGARHDRVRPAARRAAARPATCGGVRPMTAAE
jgi:uncharacterized membrane protein YbhN (UPF0104 family)